MAKAGAKSLQGLTYGPTIETRSSEIYRDISDAVKRLTGQDPLRDGNAAKARTYYAQLLKICEKGDAQGRPELAQARAYAKR